MNTKKTIWEGRVIKIPFSKKLEDAKHLKLIWINTKKEERVLIKNYSKEYKKMIPVSTQKYQDGGGMEKSVVDVTDSTRNKKLGLTTSESIDVQGMFVVKLRAQNTESHFFYTQLPMNEDGNNIDKQLSFSNFKITARKLHDCGWKNIYHKSADVAMLGYGCGVSMYPQFLRRIQRHFRCYHVHI